jgi:hypothetical protein
MEEELVFEVWDSEMFGSDDQLGVAVTTIEQVVLGHDTQAIEGKGVETFFHLLPPASHQTESQSEGSEDSAKKKESGNEVGNVKDESSIWESLNSEWIQTVIEKSTKAGAEAVGGVAATWSSFFTSEKKGGEDLTPQGRLYVKFRIAPAKDLVTVLPKVVPPAKVGSSIIRQRPRKRSSEWHEGVTAPNRMFRVLSIDGGGIRGILSAGILRRLVKSGRFPQLLEDVDLIAGTSTGGILALMIAAGYTPAEAQRLYMHHCPKIFTTTNARKYSPFSSKYENVYLRSMLNEYFQDLRLDELPTPVMLTAFKIRADSDKETFFAHSGKAWHPSLFSNILKYDGKVGPDKLLCADVALRTSAAPTYFPAYQDYVDGAIFANNPALTALAKVTSHYRHLNLDRVAVLSVGSGAYDYYIPEEEGF